MHQEHCRGCPPSLNRTGARFFFTRIRDTCLMVCFLTLSLVSTGMRSWRAKKEVLPVPLFPRQHHCSSPRGQLECDRYCASQHSEASDAIIREEVLHFPLLLNRQSLEVHSSAKASLKVQKELWSPTTPLAQFIYICKMYRHTQPIFRCYGQ